MKSGINHNVAGPSSTPTRNFFIRFKAPTSTTVSNGDNSYARDKATGKSSVSNVEKTSRGKRVLNDKLIHANDLASTSTSSLVKPKSAQVFKKAKKQTDVWNRVIPTATMFNEVQITVGMSNLGRQGLFMSLVDSEGRRACPMCKENCVSLESLYQHMDLHRDGKWRTSFTSLTEGKCPMCKENCVSMESLYQHMDLHRDSKWQTSFTSLTNPHNISESSENHNHEAALVDLTKCFADWDVKTGKRGRLGSRVADVKVNKASNAKDYLGLLVDDHVEMNVEDLKAAETLVLTIRDYLSYTKKTMTTQKEVEAAKGLAFLVDHVNPAMVESSVQVEEFRATNVKNSQLHVEDSADMSNGGIKMVLGFDLNEPPALEDDSSAKMT